MVINQYMLMINLLNLLNNTLVKMLLQFYQQYNRRKDYSDVMKKMKRHLNKELEMSKKDNEDFENCT